MSKTSASSKTLALLAKQVAALGRRPLAERLELLRRLTLLVHSLHHNGRTHRAIGVETVWIDAGFRPRLAKVPASRRFGGESDPEFCPPELMGTEVADLPEQIDAAAAVLKDANCDVDPRRIDLYQIGVVACRLLTGGPLRAYLLDPAVKARVPATADSLLAGLLGDDAKPFSDADAALVAIDDAIEQSRSAEAESHTNDTPARGSAVGPADDTPAHGAAAAAERAAGASDDETDLPFQRLGHFRITGRIGRGGMGDVYCGYDESLKREVAIKVLPPELARDPDFVRRFHTEATAAAQVAHPNVVPIYFIGEDAGHHFFAMQFVEGESLAECLKRRGRLPVDEALKLTEQCLDGLAAAHERGLTHRDIKPGNILIEARTGRPVLVDFGLVRMLSDTTRMTATGMIMGTVDYIAPEQARGLSVDGRADLYSLGVLMYQMISGRLPFSADTPTGMMFQHAYEDPTPLGEVAADVSEPVVRIVAQLMRKDPLQRYQTAAEVAADVQAYREGKPIAAGALPRRGSDASASEVDPVADVERLADDGVFARVRDFALTMLRRHAPEVVQRLQRTTQQVDGAVAHYDRRRRRLAALVDDSRRLGRELLAQLAANRQALDELQHPPDDSGILHDVADLEATEAREQQLKEDIHSLEWQVSEQQEKTDDLELQLGKVDATLAKLRSQQAVLVARLRSAEARGAARRAKPWWRQPWWIAAAVTVGLIAVAAWVLWMEMTSVTFSVGGGIAERTPADVHSSVATEEAPPTKPREAIEPIPAHKTPAPVALPPITPPPGYQPGLIARLHLGEDFDRPTNLLCVVESHEEFNYASAASMLQEDYAATESHISAKGCIFLPQDAEVQFKFENCMCRVNDKLICAGAGAFVQPIRAGLHTVMLYRPMPSRPGPRFSAVTAEGGQNVFFHREDELETELHKQVSVDMGLSEGILLEPVSAADNPASLEMIKDLRGFSVERNEEGRVIKLRCADLQRVNHVALSRRPDPGDPTDVGPARRRFTDAEAALLAGLPKLEELSLRHTHITDAGLVHLGRLRHLRVLDLGYTDVGDPGLKHLSRLAGHDEVRVVSQDAPFGGSITQMNMKIPAVSGLEKLVLRDTQITDMGLTHLAGFDNLEHLDLRNTAVGDAGLAFLAPLQRLEELILGGTRISDQGLMHLEKLPNLRKLDVRPTDTTVAGLQKLMTVLPLLEVGAEQKIETPEHPDYLD